MRRQWIPLTALVCVWLVWLLLIEVPLSRTALLLIFLAGTVFILPVILIGRRLLDIEPTIEQAERANGFVHLAVGLLLGAVVIAAVRYSIESSDLRVPFAPFLGSGLMILSGLVLVFVVVNLAVKGLGAPFAIRLTRLVATEWFYAWTRNPMILAAIIFLFGVGIWLQSGAFLLWLFIGLAPVLLIFIRVYEERELEIRFGSSYTTYKTRTPILLPRRPR